ncbi:hypothetical protein SAMN06295981_1169 [Corynebacterium pollutisoli]|uniref:Uncharacterized protein n=1 Tax=Corynebacterium pollutisoli TaxID=1610489 RepID=A0A1X7J215_9CORY|nr:hypothetical protein [Corynebacterium pollutisoli]SMG21380.1 hypothetical protein SAMN06295981_1169 [Corynebacterium pollutisoli]
MTGATDQPERAPGGETSGPTGTLLHYRRTRLRTPGNGSTRASKRTVVDDDGADVPEDTRDHWLDEVTSDEEHRRRGAMVRVMDTFAVPYLWFRRIFFFLATTPGKLVAISVILSTAIFAAGWSMSQSSSDRQQELDVLLTTTEPMSYAAHNLYTSLSLADTIATTGFVQAGVESAGTRARYNAAIDRAMMSATESSAGIAFNDRETLQLIADIERQIPIYTGLVETARTNNRMGNPVGVAYMAEASSLMREQILPDAATLFAATSSNVRDQQHQLTRPQWVPLSGLFAAVFFLLVAQWLLWRMTRRRLNRGFLAATALMAIAIVWVSASNFSTWQAGTRGFEEASMPWDSLTASRIQAQQARTSETLALVRRQSVSDTSVSFGSTADAINLALDDFEQAEGHNPLASGANRAQIIEARTALNDWEGAHDRFVVAMNTGNYAEAVRLATTTTLVPGAPPTAAASYDRLDGALSRLIADARSSMRAFINDGLAATQLVSTAVLLLSILAVLAVWIGVRPRLQEYL